MADVFDALRQQWHGAIQDAKHHLRPLPASAASAEQSRQEEGQEDWIWRTGAFAGEFGDAFIKNTNLEGGDVPSSMELLTNVIRPLVDVPALAAQHLPLLDEKDLQELSSVLKSFDEAVTLGRRLFGMRLQSEKFVAFLTDWIALVRDLPVGQFLIVNGGWLVATWRLVRGHAAMYVIERDAEDTYAFSVVNTGEGNEYHPLYRGDYPKEKRRAAIRIGEISRDTILEESFWYLLFKMRFQPSSVHGPEQLYEVLLPYLAGDSTRPEEGGLPNDCTIASNVEKQVRLGNCGDFETMQRSGTCFFRAILSTLRYCCKRRGLSAEKRKQITFAMRAAFLFRADYDLRKLQRLLEKEGTTPEEQHQLVCKESCEVRGLVGGWQHSDVTMVTMASNAFSMAAVKEVKRGSLGVEGMYIVRSLSNSLREQLEWLGMGTGGPRSIQALPIAASEGEPISPALCASLEPFDEWEALASQQPQEALDVFAGDKLEPPSSHFVDFSALCEFSKQKCSLVDIAQLLCDTRDHCDTLYQNSLSSSVSVPMHQICALVEDVICSRIPLPVPVGEEHTGHHAWQPRQKEMRKGLQLQALGALLEIAAHYTSASFSVLTQDRELSSRRAVVIHVILQLFDAMVRQLPDGECLGLTKLFLEETARPFFVSSNGFKDDYSFKTIYSTLILSSPAILEAATSALLYFTRSGPLQRSRAGGGSTTLFDWRADPSRSLTQFRAEYKDNVLALADSLEAMCASGLLMVENLPMTEPSMTEDRGSLGCDVPDLQSESLGPPPPPPSPAGAGPPQPPPLPVALSSPETQPARAGPPPFALLQQIQQGARLQAAPSSEPAPSAMSKLSAIFAGIRKRGGTSSQAMGALKQRVKELKTELKGAHDSEPPAPVMSAADKEALRRKEAYLRRLHLFSASRAQWKKYGAEEYALLRDLCFLAKLSLEPPPQLYKRNPFFDRLQGLEASKFIPVWVVSEDSKLGRIGVRIAGQPKLFLASTHPKSPADPSRHVSAGGSSAPNKPHALALLIQGKNPVIDELESNSQLLTPASVSEKDVQNMEGAKPTYNGCLSEAEAVHLLSLCTVPFMRVPLVLAFFANNLIGSLNNSRELRNILESVMFEPCQFNPKPEWIKRLPVSEKLKEKQFGTLHGVLAQELACAPDATLEPLLELLLDAVRLCSKGFSSSFSGLLLFLVRMVLRALSIRKWLLSLQVSGNMTVLGSEKENELLVVLTCEVLPLLERLAEASLESAEIGEGVRYRAVLCILAKALIESKRDLCFVPTMLSHAAYAISWNSKAKDEDRQLEEERKAVQAELDAAAEARRMRASPFAKKELEPELLHINGASESVALHECFLAIQQCRADVLDWLRVASTAELSALLFEVTRLALQWTPTGDPAQHSWSAIAPGIYQLSGAGIEVNLQTAEVYFNSRTMVPTPVEILQHPDFIEVMPTDAQPYCIIDSVCAHRQSVKVIHDEATFHVDAWSPLSAGSELCEELQEFFEASQTELFAFPKLPVGKASIVHQGVKYAPYQQGSQGWLSQLFDPIIKEAIETAKLRPHHVRSFAAEDGSGRLLTRVSPYAATGKKVGDRRSVWYEVDSFEDRRYFNVFALVEVGRQVRRSLVFTSDSRWGMAFFEANFDDRNFAWTPGTEQAAGTVFGRLFTRSGEFEEDPSFQPADGVVNKVGSITARRDQRFKSLCPRLTLKFLAEALTRSGSHSQPWQLEEFVPSRCLLGLLSEPLLSAFQFWKISDRELVGYPNDSKLSSLFREWWGGQHLLHVMITPGCGATSGAVVRRLPVGVLPTTPGEGVVVLLNPVKAKPTSILGSLATLTTQLDSISHVLVWSASRAFVGEEAEITVVELPRLKLRFAMRAGQGQAQRLYSLDHSELFVSNFGSELTCLNKSAERYSSCLLHGLVMENEYSQQFLLVPNFGLSRVQIRNCPFSTPLLSIRNFPDWEAHVSTGYYIYPVHPSGNYLQITSSAAALYMVLLRLLRRDYMEASLALNSCATDDVITEEERWILSQVKQTAVDFHPDAHAIRLRLAVACIEHAREAVDWDVEEDLYGYLQKYVHVSALCRLTMEEERLLLEYVSQGEGVMYYTTLRLRYLNALKEANETGETVELQLPSQMRFGGARIRQLYVVANQIAKGRLAREAGHIFYCYKRPTKKATEVLEGVEAMNLLQRFWDDNLYGQTHQTGFLLLYELLVGRVHMRITPHQDVSTEKVDVPSKKVPHAARLKVFLKEEGSRYKTSALNLVRLMTHSAFFRYITDRGLPPDTGLSFTYLASLVSLVESDLHQESRSLQVPYLPYKRILPKMSEIRPHAPPSLQRGFWGDHRSANHIVDDFEEQLTDAITEHMEQAPWKDSPYFRFVRLENRTYFCELGDPSVVTVKPGTPFCNRPVIEDFSCDKSHFSAFYYRAISDLPDSDANLAVLSITEEDAASFASQPLQSIGLSSFVEWSHSGQSSTGDSSTPDSSTWSEVEDSVAEVTKQTAEHKAAKTQFAAKTLERIEADVKQAAIAAEEEKIPRLKTLLQTTIQELRDTLSSDSMRTMSFVKRTSLTLQRALESIREVRQKLTLIQERDRNAVVLGVHGIEILANQFPVEPTAADVTGDPSVVLEKLCFLLERDAGHKPWLSFHLLCQALMTPDPWVQLRSYNPFLGEDRCNQMLTALAGLLMRSVRLSQANTCLTSCLQLSSAMQTLLELELECSADVGVPVSAAMKRHVLVEADYNIGLAAENLVAMEADVTSLSARFVPSDNSLDLAFMLYHFHRFDFSSSTAVVGDWEAQREYLFDLAARGCFYNGRDLTLPFSADLSTSQTAVQEREDSSLTLATIHLLQHASETMAGFLVASRHYVTGEDDGVFGFDPRFLVFEFVSDLLLRKRQVELVHQFVASAQAGGSSVQQMIMGAGKTTVICPLLALLLADGKSLVTLVVPAALMNMSRTVMRTCFSNIIAKRVYSFTFDRYSSSVSSNQLMDMRKLRVKMEVSQQRRGVIVTTPEAVKSLMLMYVDTLGSIRREEVGTLVPLLSASYDDDDLRAAAQSVMNHKRIAHELAVIMGLWGEQGGGIALLDEVDILLHPLHSELNFPIGAKEPLPASPHRWGLPFHLMEAILFSTSSAGASPHLTAAARATLDAIKAAVEEGVAGHCLQWSPHLVLVQEWYYREHMQAHMADWALVWLESQQTLQEDLVRCNSDWRTAVSSYIRRQLAPPGSAIQPTELEKFVTEHFSKASIRLLNLAHLWVSSFLPHCLSKIDRVHFGLLQSRDVARLDAVYSQSGEHCDISEVLLPEGCENGSSQGSKSCHSRRLLAVPFVGKDVPSQSSEFAHPDVLIGLSVLAYRYEGLRLDDVKVLVKFLKNRLSLEAGPYADRPSNMLFVSWYKLAGAEADAMPLEVLQPTDKRQMEAVRNTLGLLPLVIDHYLNDVVFPWTMHHQLVKMRASGEDLGSDMIFSSRLGFSGTPSDVLPVQLRPCHYEVGSEAHVLRTLVDPSCVTVKVLKNWDVSSLIAYCGSGGEETDSHGGMSFHALIDPGALITGMNNQEAARALLHALPPAIRGVVFLDDLDRKMVVDRSGGDTVPLARSGIPVNRRFTFYDQVHTTGMDVRQPINSKALVLLGKDMTFRDYAQACWRMRGLGRGQSVHVVVVQEVFTLVRSVCNSGNLLVDIASWLLLNSVRSEHLQLLQLYQQDVAHAWRRTAVRKLMAASVADLISSEAALAAEAKELATREKAEVEALAQAMEEAQMRERRGEKGESVKNLLERRTEKKKNENRIAPPSTLFHQLPAAGSSSLSTESEHRAENNACLEVFLEELDYGLPDHVPTTESLSEKVSLLLEEHKALICPSSAAWMATTVDELEQVEAESLEVQNGGERDYDSEIVQEQEQQQQQQVQSASAEDIEYGMERGSAREWMVAELLRSDRAGGLGRVFMPLHELQVWNMHKPSQKAKLQFDDDLLVSTNHTPAEHRSALQRRLKECYVSLAWKRPDNGRLQSVILSLEEAESLRQALFHLQASPNNPTSGVGLYCCSLAPGRWLTAAVDTEEAATAAALSCQLQCSRFFNCDVRFTGPDVVSLLQGISASSKERRRAFFDVLLVCHNKAAPGLAGMTLSSVFTHENAKELELVQRFRHNLREAIHSRYPSSVAAFQHFDSDRDGLVDREDLLQGIASLAGCCDASHLDAALGHLGALGDRSRGPAGKLTLQRFLEFLQH